LEWQDARSGQLIVTGKVSEWRGHVVSTDASRLIERWYSFRPTPGLSLEALPFTEEGRLVSMVGYRDRLTEAQRSEPELQVTWEKNHGDWVEHLESLRLDPELFNYQRKMNSGEGEAADAFTFKTDEAFVDWLLTAVTSEDDPRSLGDVVSGHADQLAIRGDLLDEREFVAGALDRLAPLVHAAREARAAAEIHHDAHLDAERLTSALAARHVLRYSRLVLTWPNGR